MRKKIMILMYAIVTLAVLAGIFYFWKINPENNKTEAPTLFGKEDYKIETRLDGTYIVVSKVGLTAKVPEAWKIETKSTPDVEKQYFIDLSSPDTEGLSYLKKGCMISIATGIETENNHETKNEISILERNPNESSQIKTNYKLEIINLSNHTSIEWLNDKYSSTMGEFVGVDIPIGDKKMININATFPPEYKEICQPIWEKFLENIEIK